MPRRPIILKEDIPIFLVPEVIKKEISLHGGEVEFVLVKRTAHHFYTVRIRTRPVKREFRCRAARGDTK